MWQFFIVGGYKMQSPVVMAFRKRLKKRGYSDVSIKFLKKENIYLVSAIEPLSKLFVSVKLQPTDMYIMFRF